MKMLVDLLTDCVNTSQLDFSKCTIPIMFI